MRRPRCRRRTGLRARRCDASPHHRRRVHRLRTPRHAQAAGGRPAGRGRGHRRAAARGVRERRQGRGAWPGPFDLWPFPRRRRARRRHECARHHRRGRSRSRRGRGGGDLARRPRRHSEARADTARAHQLPRPVRRWHAGGRRHRRFVVAPRHADRPGPRARRRHGRRPAAQLLAVGKQRSVRCRARRARPVRHRHPRHPAAGAGAAARPPLPALLSRPGDACRRPAPHAGRRPLRPAAGRGPARSFRRLAISARRRAVPRRRSRGRRQARAAAWPARPWARRS